MLPRLLQLPTPGFFTFRLADSRLRKILYDWLRASSRQSYDEQAATLF